MNVGAEEAAGAPQMWRCPSCNRLLVQKDLEYARRRHEEFVARARGQSAEFVREVTWRAYLASLRRCRCGSRRALKAVPPRAARGQLDLQTEAVVFQ